VDINKKNGVGQTPLYIACEKGFEGIVKILVEHRADVYKKDNDGNTPLFVACQKGYLSIVKYFAENTVESNKKGNIYEICYSMLVKKDKSFFIFLFFFLVNFLLI